MANCPAVAFAQYFLKNLNPCISLVIVLCFSCLTLNVIYDVLQIKFVRHFASVTINTWCKLKLLDIFCGIVTGFAYRRTNDLIRIQKCQVCKSLTTTFSRLISADIFPCEWKTGRVTPIHKTVCKSNMVRYWPISFFSVIAKQWRNLHIATSFPIYKRQI